MAPRNTMRTLQDFIRVFEHALPLEMCQRLIDSFKRLERFQQSNGAGFRAGLEDSSWTELNLTRLGDSGIHEYFGARVAEYWGHYNQACALTRPISPVQRISELIIKRYDPDKSDHFQPHFDALGEVSNRYLVFLWYLNDVATGGETHFVDLDVRITPRAGRLLMFPPYWMYQHAGLPPASGEKYILSTYALY